MNSDHHRDLTHRVVLAIVDDERVARIAAEWSTMPDRIDDVQIAVGPRWAAWLPCLRGRTTPTILCRRLCSLTHFAGGYDWRRDPSVPRLNLPDRSLVCLPGRWGLRGEPLHPLALDLATVPAAVADEWTYPSAPRMVAWIARHLERRPGSLKRRARLLGAMLHLVQDCCVWHHAVGHGRLLDGHLEFEDGWAIWWHSEVKSHVEALCATTRRLVSAVGAAVHCARVAEHTAALGRQTVALRDLDRHAIAATAALVRWWHEQYGKR